jgi:hypothetical protein
MREGIVYFILDTYSNSVKIGHTTIKGLEKRILNLQTGTPYELKILGLLWGDKKIEKSIHKEFKESHIRGEWFYYTEKLHKFIEDNWEFSIIESMEKKSYKKLLLSK